ncbi:molybdopterin molybdenumtransferase MoeA, partial [Ralstonia pseudosolanacearum]
MSANDAPAVKPSLLTLEAALSQLLAAARGLTETETVPTLHANGRVLAQAVRSGLNVPPADNTQMDGYAVRAADITAPGHAPEGGAAHSRRPGRPALQAGEAARIFTGALIPPGADAVVMQEQCKPDPDTGTVVIDHVPEAGEWIRRAGEDITAGAEILPRGTRLGAQQLGLAASVGC